jgi:F420-dependent oxidoreductase-like protein
VAAKIRIGIQTGLDNVEWSHLLEFWQFLDRETAFDNAWTYDHFVPPLPWQDTSGPSLEGWTALTALAQATERLRVGCLVTGVTYREPTVLAKMAATVDHISNGRLEFAIGAAWQEPEHRFYGIPFPPVKERQDRLEEAVQLTRLLFRTDGAVDFEGKYYQLKQAPFNPPCVQKPHPPIFVGGGGEKRTLRTAARYGDAMNVMASVAVTKKKIEVLEKHCSDAGRNPDEITKSVFAPIFVTDDEGRAQQMRSMLAMPFGTTADEAAEGLAIGTAEHVRGVLERYAELGVTYFIMNSQAPYDFDVYRRISDEVVSAFV